MIIEHNQEPAKEQTKQEGYTKRKKAKNKTNWKTSRLNVWLNSRIQKFKDATYKLASLLGSYH